MKLTREYMMQRCGLTEKDFEGIDFEDFVSRYELTEEALEEFSGASLLALYKTEHAMGESVDYTAIYDKAAGRLREEDIPEITAVIWEFHEGAGNRYMAIDFESGAVYGGEGFFLDACREKNRIADLTEDDREFVRREVSFCRIPEWENRCRGTSEGTTGHFAWAVGFRLASGACVDYSGSGVLNSGTPKEMFLFCKDLWNRFNQPGNLPE